MDNLPFFAWKTKGGWDYFLKLISKPYIRHLRVCLNQLLLRFRFWLGVTGRFCIKINSSVIDFLKWSTYIVIDNIILSIFSGTTGYILSLDWFGLFYRDHKGSEVVQPNQTKSFKSRSRSQKMVQSNGFLIGKEILTHIVFFCINLAVIMVYTPDFESPGSSQILPHTINSTLNNNVNITTGKLLILI